MYAVGAGVPGYESGRRSGGNRETDGGEANGLAWLDGSCEEGVSGNGGDRSRTKARTRVMDV